MAPLVSAKIITTLGLFCEYEQTDFLTDFQLHALGDVLTKYTADPRFLYNTMETLSTCSERT